MLFLVFLAPFIIHAFVAGTEIAFGANTTVVLELGASLYLFLASLWALLIWMKCIAIWTDYYLDMWVVTNRRLIDIEQYGFFHRETSTLRMEQIQDITTETRGILPTIFNFGHIYVQSAAESREFTIRGIPNPRNIKELIFKQHDRMTEKENMFS